MSLENRLFQAMLEAPDDLDLRLVFADWYREQGDPRAEFIQIQIALDRLPRKHVWWAEFQHRERDLLTEYRKTWDRPLYRQLNQTALKGKIHARGGAVRGWEYRRGFVEHLMVDAHTLMSHSQVFFQLGPLRSVRLWNVKREFPLLLAWEGLARFVKLDLRHNPLGDLGLQQLLDSPHVKRLEELCLVDAGLTDLSLDALVDDSKLPNLKRLILSQNPFSREGWERLTFRFGEKLAHENGTLPLTNYLKSEAVQSPEFLRYDDEVLYEDGHVDAEGKREIDGEYVEGYDEYEGFEEFDENELKHLGGYGDQQQSRDWIGPNKEPDWSRDENSDEDD